MYLLTSLDFYLTKTAIFASMAIRKINRIAHMRDGDVCKGFIAGDAIRRPPLPFIEATGALIGLQDPQGCPRKALVDQICLPNLDQLGADPPIHELSVEVNCIDFAGGLAGILIAAGADRAKT